MYKFASAWFLCICICLLCGCSIDSDIPKSGGFMKLGGTQYSIGQARFEWQGSVLGQGDSIMQLTLSEGTLRVNEAGISGYGALVDLQLRISNGDLFGQYQVMTEQSPYTIVADSSVFRLYKKDKSDTILLPISSGTLSITPNINGNRFVLSCITSDGASLVAEYNGLPVYNSIVVGDSVGVVQVDTLVYPMKQGELFNWGTLFQDSLYYYEFYLYSTNMRVSDKGNYMSGFYMVVGLQSSNSTYPDDGIYPVSFFNMPQTALYGQRDGSVNWGCYWQTFSSSSVSGKANILSDSLQLQQTAPNTYRFIFNMTDQMGNKVTGIYESLFMVSTKSSL